MSDDKEKAPQESNWYEIDLDNIGKNREATKIENKELKNDEETEAEEIETETEDKENKENDNKTVHAKADQQPTDKKQAEEKEKGQAETRPEVKDRTFQKGSRAEKRIRDLWAQKTQAEQRAAYAEAKLVERDRGARTQDVSRISEKIETQKKLISQAELAYEKAESEGDIKAKIKAQRDLFDSQMDLKVAEATKSHVEGMVEEDEAAPQIQRQSPAQANPLASEWAARNPWFGKDRESSAVAFALDQTLAAEGRLTPDTEEYWDELDSRLKKRGIAVTEVEETPEEDKKEDRAVQRQPSSTNLKRSGNASSNLAEGEIRKQGNKTIVKLSREELGMAKKMGVSPERFARQKVKISQVEGDGSSGWSEIDLG